jgi:hypothetical protein
MEIKIGDKVKTNNRYFRMFGKEEEGIVTGIKDLKNKRNSITLIEIELSNGNLTNISKDLLERM